MSDWRGVCPIVGTGTMRTPDSIELAEAAATMGADAILLATPPYAVPTERENAMNALTIDRAADLPIMLYNYPGRMGVSMGEEFLDIVGRSKNVCAIKKKARVISTGCICWRGTTRTSKCPVAWMIRRLSSLPGVHGLGCVPAPIS